MREGSVVQELVALFAAASIRWRRNARGAWWLNNYGVRLLTRNEGAEVRSRPRRSHFNGLKMPEARAPLCNVSARQRTLGGMSTVRLGDQWRGVNRRWAIDDRTASVIDPATLWSHQPNDSVCQLLAYTPHFDRICQQMAHTMHLAGSSLEGKTLPL